MLHSDSWKEELCLAKETLIDPERTWVRWPVNEANGSRAHPRQWECSFSPNHLVARACFLLRWFLWWALSPHLSTCWHPSKTAPGGSASPFQLHQRLLNLTWLPLGKTGMEGSTGKRLPAGLGKRSGMLTCIVMVVFLAWPECLGKIAPNNKALEWREKSLQAWMTNVRPRLF